MKQLFTTISDHLLQAVPQLRWIDADYGQADNYEIRANIAFPTALISTTITASEQGGSTQLKEANVQVKLVFNPATTRTEAHTPTQAREQSLNYLDIADKVYLALQGFKTDEYNAFECTSQTQESRNDGLLIIRLSFNTSFWDFRVPDNQ